MLYCVGHTAIALFLSLLLFVVVVAIAIEALSSPLPRFIIGATFMPVDPDSDIAKTIMGEPEEKEEK